ncbi:MAG: hypothetical protein ACXWXS_04915 [Actinomycetota bacterium]
MSQSSGFDMSKMSTAHKILLGAGVLYIIDVFLPWQRVCIDLEIDLSGASGCASASGASGIGVLNLLLAIALVVWEGMDLANVDIKAPRALISAGLAGAIVLFTILKILVDFDEIYIFAWIGLILALVIGYGGWMRWQEYQASVGGMGGSSTGGTAPPTMPGGPPA